MISGLFARERNASAAPLLKALGVSLLVLAATPALAIDKSDEKWTWDLTDIYPTVEAWDADRKVVIESLERLEGYKGTLGKSPDSLLKAATDMSDVYRKALRVYTYSSLQADEDTRNSETQERRQLSQQMLNAFSQSVSWQSPEILSIGADRIRTFLRREEELAPFRFDLEDTLRQQPHTLSEEGESLIAKAGLALGAPYDIYNLLANADFPAPTITLSDGNEVRLDSQGYSKYRAAQNRDDRKAVFDAYWGAWDTLTNTTGATLAGHVQSAVFRTRARNHDDTLTRELFSDNLPPEVYRTLVAQVNEALPALHRYFKLRERILGIENIAYYDIYPDLVSLDQTFTIDDAVRLTNAALEPLGGEYLSILKRAMEERWVHVFPQEGKRSGAYMMGAAYDVHPYVLLNHNDDFESVSTYAHEMGHAVHTVLSKQAQPFETYSYATFTAEIASVSNEVLLQEYMIANAKTPEEKLFYLGYALEQIRGTYFRQTMFSEFELAIHEEVEKGGALTGEKLSQIYGGIQRRYHGHDEGVLLVDDLYTNEWMFVPHFYYGFYVFQYSTSLAGGVYFAEQILNEEEGAVERYLDVLRAGGSKYPYDILKDAGIDMASEAPYKAVEARMNSIMDRMEAILNEME